jgi:hypothetical protein
MSNLFIARRRRSAFDKFIATLLAGGLPFIMVLVLLLGSPLAPPEARASSLNGSRVSTLGSSVDATRLSAELKSRLGRVPEFRFMQEEAKRMGVSIYLFGGTAAAYAHYVRWDLLRESGDPRFQPERFDYDFVNIYRSNQDLDIVVDGTADQIKALQERLQSTFQHVQGDRTAWEVRSLRENFGDKLALLNNRNFLDQHTDSNSTGMIDLSPKAEMTVRDLRDWNNPKPQFLNDVSEGKIHYYFSGLHDSTELARAGRNPSILSAIRILIKAVQFELEFRPKDLELIRRVIREFDPKKYPANSYVNRWIEKNAKKLVQNAVNIEYALDLVNEVGLKDKLIRLNGNSTQQWSLAWWMSKAALKSYPIQKGSGRTARQLGIDIVAHETSDFMAYESMTRAHTGDPNVLISRKNVVGEAAQYGEGFYTAMGRKGARDSGITIRFKVEPEAREGVDFIFVSEQQYVIFLNKNALRVIPESLNLNLGQYYRFLQASRFDSTDRGIIEKLNRRMTNRMAIISNEEVQEAETVVQEELSRLRVDGPTSAVLMNWISVRSPHKNRKLSDQVMDALIPRAKTDFQVAMNLAVEANDIQSVPKIVDALVLRLNDYGASGFTEDKLKAILMKSGAIQRVDLFAAVLKAGFTSVALGVIATFDDISSHSAVVEIITYFVATGYNMSEETRRHLLNILSKPGMLKHANVFDAILRRNLADIGLGALATFDNISNHSLIVKVITEYIATGYNMSEETRRHLLNILSKPGMLKHANVFDAILRRNLADIGLGALATFDNISKHSLIVKAITEYIETGYTMWEETQRLLQEIVSKKGMSNHPEIYRALLNRGASNVAFKGFAAIDDLASRPLFVKLIADFLATRSLSSESREILVHEILTKPGMAHIAKATPALAAILLQEAKAADDLSNTIRTAPAEQLPKLKTVNFDEAKAGDYVSLSGRILMFEERRVLPTGFKTWFAPNPPVKISVLRDRHSREVVVTEYRRGSIEYVPQLASVVGFDPQQGSRAKTTCESVFVRSKF